ncbi:MAG TPA: hypothetical protein VME63_00720 [Dyella sp.]|uniref:hypothetical protein n=1 Tax=Dyella sp. TaxID=1869338 RepID=UPI002BECB719|nr:hypothetical protein [Dyella sp.]HTV83899.1 hypothetical protein [Dyella sp.]
MQAVARGALIATLIPALAGCYSVVKIPEVASASVYGPGISGGALRAQQVAQLSDWLKAHDAGWRAPMGTPPRSITMAIVMRRAGGPQSTLDLFAWNDGSAMAYLYAPAPASPRERYLPAADVAALRAAVGH